MVEGFPKIATEFIPELDKTEKLVIRPGELKRIIFSELGGKAKIEQIDISETSRGLLLSAELDAGFAGGHISI